MKKINEKKVKQLLDEGIDKFRNEFLQTIRKEYPVGDIMERITCLDDILEEAGKDPQWIENLKITHSPRAVYFEVLEVITDVLNEEWVADFDDSNQEKIILVFTGGRSRFRFLYSHSYCVNTTANLGSCFPFKNKKIAEFAASLFISQFKGLLIK
jgi:hypothetical protein